MVTEKQYTKAKGLIAKYEEEKKEKQNALRTKTFHKIAKALYDAKYADRERHSIGVEFNNPNVLIVTIKEAKDYREL